MAASIRVLCTEAKAASRVLARASTEQRRAILIRTGELLIAETAAILAANAEDLAAAAAKGSPPAMQDRLRLDPARLTSLAQSVREIAAMDDPVGQEVTSITRPNGMRVRRVRVPLGLIAMVYEARPNVTVDAAALALRAGNAIVLRGGSEALNSNLALAAVVRRALVAEGLPAAALTLLPFTSRDSVKVLVQQAGIVDLAIPRGGEALIHFVTEHARVPVVQHYKGVCHLFIDAGADANLAAQIAVNGKLSRPSVCNSTECLLFAEAEAAKTLPVVLAALAEGGCEIRGCAQTCTLFPQALAAQASDFGQEFLAPIIAVKVVADLDAALRHIAKYGSEHTEAILTPNPDHARRFQHEIDAACVVVNASTRFHDGGELGLGAEIGIATSRLHWRGPMGLESLTSMKWLVDGDGQIRT